MTSTLRTSSSRTPRRLLQAPPPDPTSMIQQNVISYLATYVIATNQDASATTLITETRGLSGQQWRYCSRDPWEGDGIRPFSDIITNFSTIATPLYLLRNPQNHQQNNITVHTKHCLFLRMR